MKQLLVLVLIMLNFSCTEKIVQLPATTNQDITEVLDVSPIYMFYNEETDSVEFNRRNMISTTNWLVNIDKRLTLKQILPHLQYLQEKRHGDGMHKNENARNYFTCNNTDLKNLSFIEFTDIAYESGLNDKSLSKSDTIIHINKIDFSTLEKIEVTKINKERTQTLNYNFNELIHYIEKSVKSSELLLTFSFKSDLSFQDYIKIKTKMLTIKSD